MAERASAPERRAGEARPSRAEAVARPGAIGAAPSLGWALADPSRAGAAELLWLQRVVGNRVVQRMCTGCAAGEDKQRGRAPESGAGTLRAKPSAGATRAAPPDLGGIPVGAPDDALEREADQAAERVLATPVRAGAEAPPPPAAGPLAAAAEGVQRACARCEEDEEQPQQKVQASSAARAPGSSLAARAPGSVIPGGGGAPLPAAERAFFEPRFGHDFSRVRVHTGPTAAASARSLGAAAYTLGDDVVFGAGQYAPANAAGRRLLAHELAHVVQQSGGAAAAGQPQLSPAAAAIQRLCTPAPCPLISVPVTGLYPVWREAELCITQTYRAAHPGNTVSAGREWVGLLGRDPAERQALKCLQGGATPNFTGPSGMYAGQPDLWDFTDRSMFEITTPSGVAERVTRLGLELGLANAITSTMDCGGTSYFGGAWAPPASCYFMGGNQYMSVVNSGGLLVYQVVADETKEAELAALLALLAVAAKSSVKTGAATVGKKLIPAYAVASLVATVALLASGKAEAKIGPGAEEPIVQLFKAMADKGTPLPPEIQKMIEDDPALRDKIDEAMTKGDSAAVNEELNAKIIQIINDNKDQLSKADLEALLTMTGAAGASLPQSDVTLETLRKAIDRKAAGGGASGTTGAAGGAPAPTGTTGTAPTGTTGTTGTAPTGTTGTAPTGTTGTASTGTAPTGTTPTRAAIDARFPSLGEASRKRLAEASTPVRALFEAMVGPGGKGPVITDADVARFFAIVPADIKAKEAQDIVDHFTPVGKETVDEVFAQLQAAVKGARPGTAIGTTPTPDAGTVTTPDAGTVTTPDAGAVKKPSAGSDPSKATGPGQVAAAPPQSAADAKRQAAAADPATNLKLKEIARNVDASDIKPGGFSIRWIPDNVQGNHIAGILIGLTPQGAKYAMYVEFDNLKSDGKTMDIRYTVTSAGVLEDGGIVIQAGAINGQSDTITLDPGSVAP
jgi:hypothetical protein